ncbi:MAG: tetratricopeptide repeat protein [Pirellulaceae bacterium]
MAPESADNTTVAVHYNSIGDAKDALACLEKAIALDRSILDRSIYCRRTLADVLRQLGERERALAVISKAIENNPKPNDPSTFYLYLLRGGLYTARQMYASALADYDKSIELGPFRSFTYKCRAKAHFRLKDYDKALADIAKAVELLPEDISNLTWFPLSEGAKCPEQQFRTGLLELADKTIALTNKAARAYAARGRILAAFGQENLALADLQTAFDAIPKDDQLVHQQIGRRPSRWPRRRSRAHPSPYSI